jgi:hypothetical protein
LSPSRGADCFYPGTIDIPEKDPHIELFERCVENIKDKLRGFRNIWANEASSREFISPALLAAILLIPATKLAFSRALDSPKMAAAIGEDHVGELSLPISFLIANNHLF